MNPRLQHIQHALRQLQLLKLVEGIRYWMSIARNYRRNAEFVKQNPDFPLPPKHLAYDAYASPDWPRYKLTGEATAEFIANLLRTHLSEHPIERILEWGCGPGRVIRHLPLTLGPSASVYGSDFNEETIQWCSQHIRQVTFVQNALKPPYHSKMVSLIPFTQYLFSHICLKPRLMNGLMRLHVL